MTDETKNSPGRDPQAVLEKYDKESRTRSGNGSIGTTVTILAVSLSLYHFITSYFGTPVTLVHRSIHVAAILALTFLLYPASSRLRRDKLHWWDLGLALLGVSTAVYMYF